jgi:hypothetical protein
MEIGAQLIDSSAVFFYYEHDDEHEHESCEIVTALRTIEDLTTKSPRTEDHNPGRDDMNNLFSIEGKTAIITGGSRGIGETITCDGGAVACS